ncbi:hypothetical protein KEM52_000873 [Ascosphaera acerosa]|nr:hypothetical protein KEM52_000873 [Ascosphaera acerosa]
MGDYQQPSEEFAKSQCPAYTPMPNFVKALEKAGRDFRSDTITVPNQDVMQAILEASVGDDVFDEDDSVHKLEKYVAELTGKEAAMWVVSGTMSNQICLRTHLMQPPHSVLCDKRAHIYVWESGAMPALSQASVTAVAPSNGVHLTLKDVKANIIPEDNLHFPPTRVVALENTLNGTILPLSHAKEISAFVRSFPVPEGQKPVAMHLDGARLFDAVAGEGVDIKEYAACFDSISLCLSKGLGAPMGSIIVGTKRFIQRARWTRKMFGGGTRQPGMMAAAGLAGIKYAVPRLPAVHALAKQTAARLEKLGYKFGCPVQTNMVILDLGAVGIPAAELTRYCEEAGLWVWKGGSRFVFHQQTTQQACDDLVAALTRLMDDKKAGKFADETGEVKGYF